MSDNLERCFHRAMLKHFPGEDGDTDEEFWVREEEKREKRRGRAARSHVCTRSRDSEAPGRKQQPAENGGKSLPPGRRAASSGAGESSGSAQPPGEVGTPNSRSLPGPLHYGGPGQAPLSSQLVRSSFVLLWFPLVLDSGAGREAFSIRSSSKMVFQIGRAHV